MKQFTNDHDRTCALLMQSRVEGTMLAAAEGHIAGCERCQASYRQMEDDLRSLKQVTAVASQELVRETQMRVRARVRRLNQQRERVLPLRLAAIAALGWSVVSTPLLWGAMHTLPRYFNAPTYVWGSGLVFTWLAPSALIGAAAIARRDRRPATW